MTNFAAGFDSWMVTVSGDLLQGDGLRFYGVEANEWTQMERDPVYYL